MRCVIVAEKGIVEISNRSDIVTSCLGGLPIDINFVFYRLIRIWKVRCICPGWRLDHSRS